VRSRSGSSVRITEVQLRSVERTEEEVGSMMVQFASWSHGELTERLLISRCVDGPYLRALSQLLSLRVYVWIDGRMGGRPPFGRLGENQCAAGAFDPRNIVMNRLTIFGVPARALLHSSFMSAILRRASQFLAAVSFLWSTESADAHSKGEKRVPAAHLSARPSYSAACGAFLVSPTLWRARREMVAPLDEL
jgi:hypothetical protein